MCGKIIIPVAAFRPIPILLALLFALAHHAAGQPADSLRLVHHTPQPLTADLATEISPELSPNQKYLIYGSQAGGNYDIWVRPLAGGIAVPLTNHPADDHSPQWSSKGKVVAFVSHRDDIEGDIFALYLEESRDRLRAAKIAPLVSDSGPQSFPSHSRDGRYLVYQDGGAAQARLILLDLRRGKKTILTEPGYLQPRFSPVDDRILCLKSGDGDSPGALCILQMHDLKNPTPEIQVVYDGLFPAAFPAWSPDGESFVAALTNHDLDGDGMLTYLDRAQLYRFDPDDEGYGYRLLFPGDSRATYPCWGTDDFVYFASDPRGNLDLYRLPANGAIPPAPSAEAGFQFALSLGREAELLGRSLRRDESLAILFALERVRMYFPRNRTMAARSLLESARLSVKMGAQDEAIASLRKLVRGYSDQGEAVGQGLIDYHFLVHRAAIAPEDEIAAANPASLIANLEDVQRQFSDQPTVLARCRWLSGRIWLALGDSGKARELFDSILRDFPGLDEWAAQALLSKASLIEKSGDWEGALRLYNELLQKYPHEIAPIERAVQRIFSIELQGSEADPILSELANQQESPALAAGAIRRLAEFSLQSADTNGAIIEYNRLRGLTEASPTSFVRQTFAEGWMAAAALEAQQGRMEAALTRLAEVQESCSDLQDGFYSRKARQLRISFLTKQAEDAATRGQDRIAMRFFQRALDLDPRSVPLHRGYIAAAFSAGDLPRVTEEYRQMRSSQENDPVYLYSLGLCLSYIAGNNRRFLAQSNELLEAAMAQQPDLTFGYLTLGYNYGLMEKLAGKKGRRQNWMERAIAILQLGLAVNDENKDPGLEGQLWLDLGNSYYELGEYGYARALQAYQQREIYDSTFASPVQAALTFEKMGRAAAMTSDEASALKSYQQSLEHWRLAEHPSAERRLLLRLAELHQVSGNFDLSIEYYKQAAALAQAKGLKADSAKWLTNCSYNALQMDKIAEAAAYASQALPLLGDIKTSFEDSIRNPLALEILGITIPLWDFGFLGAGSPASARGFSDQENKQLTLSILQEVHEKQGDFVAARREAFRRLASAVERKDREMEARLWSEIGFLDWRLGDPTLARRGFLRSLTLCQEENLKSGRLAALINLASLELEYPNNSYFLPPILQDEIASLSQAEIGFSQEQWQEMRATIAAMNPSSSASAISRQIRGSRSVGFDPERLPPEPLNWNPVEHLLWLRDDPLPDANSLRRAIRSEIDVLRRERMGFDLERLRLLSLYASLCMREALTFSDSTLIQNSDRLRWEGEALWALQYGQSEASRLGRTEQEILIRLALADLRLRLQDPTGSVSELAAAKDLAEQSNNSNLIWRIYWRLGRASILAEKAMRSIYAEGFDLVNSRLPEEWLELAQEAWGESLRSDSQQPRDWQNPSEVRLMFELSAERALAQGNAEEVFGAAQKIAAWSFLQNQRPGGDEVDSLPLPLALPSDTLKKILYKGDLLLQILEIAGRTEFILLRPNGLSLYAAENANGALAQLDSLRRHEEFDSPRGHEASREILAALFAPLREQFDQVDRLFLVAPPRWDNVPFEWLLAEIDSSLRDLTVIRLTMPQSLLLPVADREKLLKAPVSFGIEAPLSHVIPAGLGSASKSREDLENASLVLIRTHGRPPVNPLVLPLFSDVEKTWSAKDLIPLKRSGGALVLQGKFEDAAPIAQAALLGGFTCVLFLPADAPDSALESLISFMQRLSSAYSWPKACRMALQNLRQDSLFLDARCYSKITPKSEFKTGEWQRILQDDEAILKYSWQDHGGNDPAKLNIQIATSEVRSTLELDISPKALETLLRCWHAGFERRLPLEKECRSLYDQLILPALPHLAGKSQLIIIPNNDLTPIAFAALKSPKGDYLLDQFAISFASSMSEFITCRQLAFSRMAPDDSMVVVLGSSRPSPGLPRLLFAEKEARSIASTVSLSELLPAENTTKATLAQRAQSAPAIHFAGHTSLPKDDQQKALHLFPDEDRDGRWISSEIENLNLNSCSLVVLSCCGEGRAISPGGSKIASLTDAFLSAGSPRVISALGEADDFVCSVLFKHFYRHLKAGVKPSQALRMAQLHLRNRLKPHPGDWAAFGLWGEPR